LRIATYQHSGQRHVGQVSADGQHVTAFDLSADLAQRGALPLVEAAANGQPLPALRGDAVPVSAVQLEAPIPLPRRNIWCVGRNYHAHAKELAASVFKNNSANTQEWPIVFTKVPECVVGPTDEVRLPGAGVSEQIDYEAELAVIIGTGGKNIRREEAMRHVWGYTIVNDVTARDVQMRHQQWDMGKSFDTFCPMGPWIVTADELDGTRTRVRCWVNGEQRQEGPTENMIFDIPTLIETISRGITLYPGDIIATGTPAGVGMGLNPPRYLQPGDVVRIEVDGIGQIENRFA
jgi:2-keto-4-pentenoate hydratase/2-oxohepta-3-ene-1,7-dioic acid hydratase in catechol pathway